MWKAKEVTVNESFMLPPPHFFKWKGEKGGDLALIHTSHQTKPHIPENK